MVFYTGTSTRRNSEVKFLKSESASSFWAKLIRAIFKNVTTGWGRTWADREGKGHGVKRRVRLWLWRLADSDWRLNEPAHAVVHPTVVPVWAQIIESTMMQQRNLSVWARAEVIKVTCRHARLKEVQQEVNQGRERNHNHANCVWLAASRSELVFCSPDWPPHAPPPHHTNGFNRRSAWLGCGHTSNPEEW